MKWEIKCKINVEAMYEMNDSCWDDGELSTAKNTELGEYELSAARLELKQWQWCNAHLHSRDLDWF